MYDSELDNMLSSSEMKVAPDAGRVQALREQLIRRANTIGRRPRRYRSAAVAAIACVTVAGIGLGATETGRALIQWVLTPIDEAQSTQWQAPDGELWTHIETARDRPLTPDEEAKVADRFAEDFASKHAGEGRLAGLIESPGFAGISQTVYLIEYTHSDGTKQVVGSGRPAGEQARNMQLDEIMQLRDDGAGEIVAQEPFAIGMAKYTLRFALSDGASFDLQTFFPPGTREERERIFGEMRELKAALQFEVLSAFVDPGNPLMGVWGNARYHLADGRFVGATEQLPPDVISEDGLSVVMPGRPDALPIAGAQPPQE